MNPRSVLMLSYPFPPAASAAVFRTLRFVKYLPEFGWQPLVLTPRVDAVYPITVDESLEAMVPPGAIVERTRVLRPLVSTGKAIGRLRSIGHHQRKPNSTMAEAAAPRQGDSGRRPQQGPKLLGSFVEAFERWAATPDRHVGWLLPAVIAALPLCATVSPAGHLLVRAAAQHPSDCPNSEVDHGAAGGH